MKKAYLLMAKRFARLSPCLRVKYGCVIVNKGEVISFGFNEPVYYKDYCKICKRGGKAHGEDYSKDCPALHSEEWAIVNAIKVKKSHLLRGATIYISGINMPENPKPCWHCRRLLNAVGIKKVVIG